MGNCVPFLFAIRLDILIQTMYNLVMELKEATKMTAKEARITELRQDVCAGYLKGMTCGSTDDEASEYLAKKSELGDLELAMMDARN